MPKSGVSNEDSGSEVSQLLGMKGAKQETDIWKIRLQLTKPVTWVPLLWGKQKYASGYRECACFGQSKVSLLYLKHSLDCRVQNTYHIVLLI